MSHGSRFHFHSTLNRKSKFPSALEDHGRWFLNVEGTGGHFLPFIMFSMQIVPFI